MPGAPARATSRGRTPHVPVNWSSPTRLLWVTVPSLEPSGCSTSQAIVTVALSVAVSSRETETQPWIVGLPSSGASVTVMPMRASECRMARASAIPPSPGAPRTVSIATGSWGGRSGSGTAGGFSTAATRAAARSATAARSGAVASPVWHAGRRLLEPERGLAVGRDQRPPQLACGDRDAPGQHDAASAAGVGIGRHVAQVQRLHQFVHQYSRLVCGQPSDGRHQNAAPGDISGAQPCLRALVCGLEGAGQVAAGRERHAQR